MASLEKRLQNPDYKTWVKAGVCLGFVKTGLEQFADEKSRLFHKGILNQLQSTGNPSSQNVCSQAKVLKGKTTCCYNCQCYVDEIDRQNNYCFKFQPGNWSNSDTQLWPKDPWEMAKVFMNPGQKAAQRSPFDTDLSGILNFIDHCSIAKGDIVNTFNISKVRDGRNSVMHSASMTLAHSDFIKFTDAMIDLLEDPGALGKMADAQQAVKNIQAVRLADFHISKEAEFKVLTQKSEALQLKLKLLQKEVLKIRTETAIIGLETKKNTKDLKELEQTNDENVSQLKHQIEAMQVHEDEVCASLVSLKKKIEEDKDLREEMQIQVEDIENSLIEIKPKLKETIQDISLIRDRLDALENQSKFQKEQGTILMSRQATLEDRESVIEEQVHELQTASSMLGSISWKEYSQEVEKLQEYLVEEYKRIGFEISLSPIYEGLNNDVMRVSIDELYTDLTIVKLEKKEEVALRSYKEIFCTKGKKNRTIFVKGEAGVRKSTWCMQLLYIWSKLHDKNYHYDYTRDISNSSNSVTTDIEEALSLFDLLIFVPLRIYRR